MSRLFRTMLPRSRKAHVFRGVSTIDRREPKPDTGIPQHELRGVKVIRKDGEIFLPYTVKITGRVIRPARIATRADYLAAGLVRPRVWTPRKRKVAEVTDSVATAALAKSDNVASHLYPPLRFDEQQTKWDAVLAREVPA